MSEGQEKEVKLIVERVSLPCSCEVLKIRLGSFDVVLVNSRDPAQDVSRKIPHKK